MKLALTIDVEEEGLFCGRYDPGPAPCKNVSRVALLDPLFTEYEIRPTLLVSYQVARDPARLEKLVNLANKWGGEVGAHLHPWNTPPLEPIGQKLAGSEEVAAELLAGKLATLLNSLRTAGVNPTSFRMGRFNLGPRMLSVISQAGLVVDSSVCPMRRNPAGPDHLAAPTDPYYPDSRRPGAVGGSSLLEVPVTVLPLFPGSGIWLEKTINKIPAVDRQVSWLAQHLFSLPAQPFWQGLLRLKIAVLLHKHRKGRLTTIFFHSSELIPGGCPSHRTEEDVQGFIRKLSAFVSWLRKDLNLDAVTLTRLRELGPWPGEILNADTAPNPPPNRGCGAEIKGETRS